MRKTLNDIHCTVRRLGLGPSDPIVLARHKNTIRISDLMGNSHRKNCDYVTAPYPSYPASGFGVYDFPVNGKWGMLANADDPDSPGVQPVGDCGVAMVLHKIMRWVYENTGKIITFTDNEALRIYGAITGWPGAGDNGTNMFDLLTWFMNNDVYDADGGKHRTGPFVFIDTHNIDHVLSLAWAFQGLACAFSLPKSADDQFLAGKPWTLTPGSPTLGGHAVPIEGFLGPRVSSKNVQPAPLVGITWGQTVDISEPFFLAKCFEAVVVIPLVDGELKTPEGFDLAMYQEMELDFHAGE